MESGRVYSWLIREDGVKTKAYWKSHENNVRWDGKTEETDHYGLG